MAQCIHTTIQPILERPTSDHDMMLPTTDTLHSLTAHTRSRLATQSTPDLTSARLVCLCKTLKVLVLPWPLPLQLYMISGNLAQASFLPDTFLRKIQVEESLARDPIRDMAA
jgi:hypothetical protein